jgi:hypothetical protein
VSSAAALIVITPYETRLRSCSMLILIGIVFADVVLLGLTVWSAMRPRPAPRLRIVVARGDGKIPHAL